MASAIAPSSASAPLHASGGASADALPAYQVAPGDIYPRGAREERLCAEASHPDWLYLGGLLGLDAAIVWAGSTQAIKYSDVLVVRMSGPVMIGLTWGATVSGAWLAVPKCSPLWVGETPREGAIRATWPLAISLSILAGITAPIVNAIAVGSNLPWSTFESEMHVVAAAVSGVGGALIPYLLPPRTWAAARELDRLRFGADGHGTAFIEYKVSF